MSKGFFGRLTSSSRFDEENEYLEETYQNESYPEENPTEGELSVGVYRDGNVIVVKAMIPAVEKTDIELQLSRNSLTISGVRHEQEEIHEEHYFYRGLYWGSFGRTIHLPDEVDIDAAEALEEKGLLTIRLPILDKKRQNRLNIRNK